VACRIGITTNLAKRKTYWSNVHSTFSDWKVLGGPMSRQKAQNMETQLAKQYRCEAHPGGDEPDNPSTSWYVYYFTY